ncbi:MAG: cupredoxin family protein [Burkholderiaceae bacterium]
MKFRTISPLALLFASLAWSVGSTALAHGDKAHDKPPVAIKKEQKDWGIAGDARDVVRTIDIQMDDNMRFTPDRLEVERGQTVRFRLANKGKVLHEMVLGTATVLAEHAALMKRFPNMEHDEPYMAHVPPGKAGEIVWTFNRAGTFDFACLIAGHFEAGMVGKIVVN